MKTINIFSKTDYNNPGSEYGLNLASNLGWSTKPNHVMCTKVAYCTN